MGLEPSDRLWDQHDRDSNPSDQTLDPDDEKMRPREGTLHPNDNILAPNSWSFGSQMTDNAIRAIEIYRPSATCRRPLGPHLGPYGPLYSIFGSNRGKNWYGTILEMLMVDFCSISTKFQPEWTDFGPFQTIFGFLSFFGC